MPCVNFAMRATMNRPSPSASVAESYATPNHDLARILKMMNEEYVMGLRKTGASREWNAIDGRFDTTLNAMALALRQKRIRSQNVVANEGGIKEFTAGLAGGMQIRMDGESDRNGIQALPAPDNIRDTVEPNDVDTEHADHDKSFRQKGNHLKHI